MASKKISQLTSGSIPSLTGVTAISYSGTTFQHTLLSLRQTLVDSGSHYFTGSQVINGNLTVSGSLTAQQYILSSSITNITLESISGSSVFGNDLNDIHSLTGSVRITGSLGVSGSARLRDLFIGSGSFHNSNPEILAVHGSGSYNIAHFQGNNNIYSQVNITNTNSGTNASTDLVLTADNGTENNHYIDLGINSSTYTGGLVGYENDSYLLNVGKNMYVGTVGGSSHTANLKLFAENLWENPQITISGSRQISFNTGSVSNGFVYEFSGSAKFTNNTTLNEITNIESVSEKIITHNNPSTGITHNFISGSIAYVSGATSDFILDVTNIPTTNNRAIGLTVIIEQGSPAYKITDLQINSDGGNTGSINWYGGSQPSGTINSTDIFAFSLIKVNNTWKVLGQKTSF